MRKVILRMDEHNKYIVIKQLVETNGNKRRVSIILNLTVRQVNRLINKYKKEGKSAFVHGNRSKEPKNKADKDFLDKIITLVEENFMSNKQNYLICNYSHLRYLLYRDYNITISYTALRNLLLSKKYRSSKSQRKTRKRLKKEELLAKIKKQEPEEIIKQIVDHEIKLEDAHPRKERAKYMGEVVQMDACSKTWGGNFFAHLHLAIDECTGKVLGAYFDNQETLNGYYSVFKQILLNYGIPNQFLTDKRTVFIYKHHNSKTDGNDTLTQFAFACKNLGTEIKTSSVPEFKGMVERLNQTFEDRLSTEIKCKGIKTLNEANSFLRNFFVDEHNRLFASKTKAESVFEKVDHDKIDYYLSRVVKRKIDKGCCVTYKGQYYAPYNEKDERLYYSRTDCLVIETFNKELLLSVDDKIHVLKLVEKNKAISPIFDEIPNDIPVTKERSKYIPPSNHPWRFSNFDKFQQAFASKNYNSSN